MMPKVPAFTTRPWNESVNRGLLIDWEGASTIPCCLAIWATSSGVRWQTDWCHFTRGEFRK